MKRQAFLLHRFRVQREVGMPGHGARVRILRMNLKKHHKSGQSGHLGHSNKHPVAAELLVRFPLPIADNLYGCPVSLPSCCMLGRACDFLHMHRPLLY